MYITLSSSHTIMFDCAAICNAIMRAHRRMLEEARKKAADERTAVNIIRVLKAIDSDDYHTFEYYQWYREKMDACVDNNPQHRFFSIGALQKFLVKLLQGAERARIKALSGRRAQGSQRLPQSDLKSIALHASMPVPPTMNWKGGQLYAQWIGV